VVVGSTGSGKTTFAQELARRLGGLHVELDALHWDPNWTAAPRELFRARVAAALEDAERWVVDGNYSAVRDLVWPRADAVIWLDYSLGRTFYQLARRCVGRGLRREELWNGNREELRTHLFTRESLFLWLFKTYWRRRRQFPELLALPEHAHLAAFRLRSPRAAAAWLDAVRSGAGDGHSDRISDDQPAPRAR
jgi:adenylate kinase family enzyme